MGQNTEGAKKAAQTMAQKRDAEYMERYGMTWRQYIGSLGGKKSVGKTGFALMDKEKLYEISVRGGRASRRNSKDN